MTITDGRNSHLYSCCDAYNNNVFVYIHIETCMYLCIFTLKENIDSIFSFLAAQLLFNSYCLFVIVCLFCLLLYHMQVYYHLYLFVECHLNVVDQHYKFVRPFFLSAIG